VISIFHAISARNVQLRIEQITTPHYANAEAALDDLKKRLFDEFFGEAYVRARQLQDKIRRVGIAFKSTSGIATCRSIGWYLRPCKRLV
jgi:hypothetical protein